MTHHRPTDISGRHKPLPSSPRERFRLSSWTWELLSFLVSVTCTGTILVILAHLDQKPLADLGLLTVNGIIGTLAGVCKAALILPIAEAISQLKWLWFWDAGNPKPISDFQVYDSASRGPWGSLCLLFQPRLTHYGTIGALLTIVALAVEPSLQLIPSYSSRLVPQKNLIATVPTIIHYIARDVDYADFDRANAVTAAPGLKAAFYNGIFGSSDKNRLSAICPTGNCTFGAYSSLAICSACGNITSTLKPLHSGTGPKEKGVWRLPNGFVQDYEQRFLTQWTGGNLPYAQHRTDWSISYPHMQNYSLLDVVSLYYLIGKYKPAVKKNIKPMVSECILYFCVQTYSGEVVSGEFKETVVESWPDPKLPLPSSMTSQWSVRALYDIGRDFYGVDTPKNASHASIVLTPDDKRDANYTLDYLTLAGSRYWLSNMMTGGVGTGALNLDTIAQTVYNMYTGGQRTTKNIAESFPNMTAEQVHQSAAEMPGPDVLWGDIAASMTAFLRTYDPSQAARVGEASTVETFIQARWVWAILPLSLLAATLVFVVLTVIISTKKNIPHWKSNSLPSMLHGLDFETSHAIAGYRRPVNVMEKHAKAFEMAMVSEMSQLQLEARARARKTV